MKILAHSTLLLAALLMSAPAQAADGLEEYFYSSGKIKVVVAVAAVVMCGLLYYVWHLDRKMTKMEERMDQNNKK
jgi:hypothetical protein